MVSFHRDSPPTHFHELQIRASHPKVIQKYCR
jgi:hypothetical protein